MSGVLFKPAQLWVLAWILLADVIATIFTLGHWSPRLYNKAFNSRWLEVWMTRPEYMGGTTRGGE